MCIRDRSSDDVPFSLCHGLYFVYFFLSVCHYKRPPMIYFIIEDLSSYTFTDFISCLLYTSRCV